MSVFDVLDREWRRLGADAAAARRLVDVCQLAGGARSLDEVERYVRAAGPPEADRVLVALAARAVEGDTLAARVLLQLLLPGARRLARTWWALGDPEERASAAVAAVYARIRRYPLARRPRRIAANVLMDAGADLRRAARAAAGTAAFGDRPSARGARGADVDLGPGAAAPASDRARVEDVPDVGQPVHPAVELAAVLADAVRDGLVTAEDAELIAASRIAGTPLAEIADRRGAKLRTLQWRRKRAEALLAGTGPAA